MKLTCFALLFLSFAISDTAPVLPKPTGELPIGKTHLMSGSESVLLWYPAADAPTPPTGKQAPYAEFVEEAAKDGYYDQSRETIYSWRDVKTHSIADAKPRAGKAPLIVFLPGAGIFGFQYTAFAEEFASRGYAVAVIDYFSPKVPKRTYNEEDSGAMSDDMAKKASETVNTLAADPKWSKHIRFTRVGAAGHSIGGSAAIAVARMDKRFSASIDMDGAPFGLAKRGAQKPVLVLRSKPIYSEADMKKRGRTKEEWDRLGAEAAKIWNEFTVNSAPQPVQVLSVRGTGHFSFSDAPFVMPTTITRFGGDIIAPERGQAVQVICATEFFARYVLDKKSEGPKCAELPEILQQLRK
jgi:hypothetical protein